MAKKRIRQLVPPDQLREQLTAEAAGRKDAADAQLAGAAARAANPDAQRIDRITKRQREINRDERRKRFELGKAGELTDGSGRLARGDAQALRRRSETGGETEQERSTRLRAADAARLDKMGRPPRLTGEEQRAQAQIGQERQSAAFQDRLQQTLGAGGGIVDLDQTPIPNSALGHQQLVVRDGLPQFFDKETDQFHGAVEVAPGVFIPDTDDPQTFTDVLSRGTRNFMLGQVMRSDDDMALAAQRVIREVQTEKAALERDFEGESGPTSQRQKRAALNHLQQRVDSALRDFALNGGLQAEDSPQKIAEKMIVDVGGRQMQLVQTAHGTKLEELPGSKEQESKAKVNATLLKTLVDAATKAATSTNEDGKTIVNLKTFQTTFDGLSEQFAPELNQPQAQQPAPQQEQPQQTLSPEAQKINQRIDALSARATELLKRVNTPEEAAKLPPGTQFIDPSGVVRIVPE